MTILRSRRQETLTRYWPCLVLVSVFAVAACGSGSSSSQSPADQSIASQTPDAQSSTPRQAPNAHSLNLKLAGASGQGIETGQSPAGNSSEPSSPQAIPSPAASVNVTNLTSQEQDLLSQLTAQVFTWCDPYPSAESLDIVAALSCVPFRSGPVGKVGVYEYVNLSALQRAMVSSATEVTDNHDCASGEYVGSWNSEGVYEGGLVCQSLSLDPPREFLWSFPGDAVRRT